MPPMKSEDRNKLITHMLSELENPAKRLTQWEQGFYESISDYWDRNGYLSERQFGTLEKIYAERTA